jgi:ketosteroid isomerase-like protein
MGVKQKSGRGGMTESETIRKIVRSAYEARNRGDLDGTMASFADDAVFGFNGEGTGLPSMASEARGKPAVRRLIQEFIESFRFSDWQEVSFVVEGEKAALHWRANVTFTPNGRSERFEVFDFLTFRDGKIIELRQGTDTAKIRSMLEN